MIHDACTYDVYIHDACMMYPGCMNTGCIYCKKFVLSYLIILAWRAGSKTSSLFGPTYVPLDTLSKVESAQAADPLYREQLLAVYQLIPAQSVFAFDQKLQKFRHQQSYHCIHHARRLSQL